VDQREIERYWDEVWPEGGFAAARRFGDRILGRRFGRVAPSARRQAVDVALWQIARHPQVVTNPEAVLTTRVVWRVQSEIARDAVDDRWVPFADGIDTGADPTGGNLDDVPEEILVEQCWRDAASVLVPSVQAWITVAAAGGHQDRLALRAQVGAVAQGILERAVEDSSVRARWEHDQRFVAYQVLRSVDPDRWGRYPADRLPTTQEIRTLSERPAADRQALNSRVLGLAIDLVSSALAAVYGDLTADADPPSSPTQRAGVTAPLDLRPVVS
jgi:hypothetical protein